MSFRHRHGYPQHFHHGLNGCLSRSTPPQHFSAMNTHRNRSNHQVQQTGAKLRDVERWFLSLSSPPALTQTAAIRRY